ncbi:hypothetical protein EVG20_g510 [Dentipellis fragilis]|uniref:Uncharacterized protein n=1 Tax=Dentipellis fragilis TaxID=205917 RepID=A0A4Y9ZFD2_9AGAM|nr:hypothetical protein EVG20_g510 [Dentipellis fragilis]
MVNWTDPAEELRETQSFTRVILSCFGLYFWELFETCGFEWSILTGRRRFRWHLVSCYSSFSNLVPTPTDFNGGPVFFFLCRYTIFFSLVGLIVSISVTERINCAALYTFNAIVGDLSIMTASTVLMIRTIVMWERNVTISAILGVIGLAMVFDLLIMVLAAARVFARTGIFNIRALLFDEGLIFFFLSGVCNIVPAVFSILDLNPVMNIITTVPISTISAIAACRTVIQLPEVQSDLFIHVSNVMGENTTVRHIHTQRRTIPHNEVGEIQMKTERYVMEDFSDAQSGISRSPSDVSPLGKRRGAL